MKVAYIVGAYRARGIWNMPVLKWLRIAYNTHKARQVALKYWRKGYAVICPHSNTAFFDNKCPDAIFLSGGLEFVRVSDIIVVMKGWEGSQGSVGEIAEAIKLGKEIVYI